jgi:hypothetical protein
MRAERGLGKRAKRARDESALKVSSSETSKPGSKSFRRLPPHPKTMIFRISDSIGFELIAYRAVRNQTSWGIALHLPGESSSSSIDVDGATTKMLTSSHAMFALVNLNIFFFSSLHAAAS